LTRDISDRYGLDLYWSRPVTQAIVTTTNARGNASQRQLIEEVAATGTLLIVVPAAMPYYAAYVSGADAIMVTDSSRPVAMRAAADVILGVARPTGLLPVFDSRRGRTDSLSLWARPELLGSLRTHVL
jgi:hypothetical protein